MLQRCRAAGGQALTMYERYYGLKEKPFSLTPDPEFLFVNKYVRGALDNVIYGIERHEGFTSIVGDVGTGKTTLCWALLGKLDKSIRTALILNPLLSEEDMLKAILQDFGVKPKYHPAPFSNSDIPYDPSWMQGLTRKELVDELNRFLLEGSEEGAFNILIVDEAQDLSLGVLEQLRLLSNLETAKKKLLQIIFVGQLEFQQKLNLPQLRQLDQRITIRYALKPMSKAEMVQYIEHRLAVAGSKGNLGFTKGALRDIYSYSRGYPRLINIICDRSLLAGYSEHSRVITAKMVGKAARGLRGKEKSPGARLSKSWRVILPIAAVLVLALLAALFVWIWRGSIPYLSGNLKEPGVMLAATLPDPLPPAAQAAAKVAAPPAPSAPTTPAPAAPTTQLEEVPKAASDERDSALDIPMSRFKGKFLLQVHSLTNEDKAHAALTELEAAGYPSFYKAVKTPKGRRWYVVYSGPFDSLQDARMQDRDLRQMKNFNPIIRAY
jgi:general secretion pathway protein A